MDEKNETDIDEMIITNDIIQDIINNIIYEIENDHPLIRRSKFDDDKIESPTLIVLEEENKGEKQEDEPPDGFKVSTSLSIEDIKIKKYATRNAKKLKEKARKFHQNEFILRIATIPYCILLILERILRTRFGGQNKHVWIYIILFLLTIAFYINLFLAWYISKMSKTILEILFRTLRTYKILLLCILRLTTDIIYVIHYHEYHIIIRGLSFVGIVLLLVFQDTLIVPYKRFSNVYYTSIFVIMVILSFVEVTFDTYQKDLSIFVFNTYLGIERNIGYRAILRTIQSNIIVVVIDSIFVILRDKDDKQFKFIQKKKLRSDCKDFRNTKTTKHFTLEKSKKIRYYTIIQYWMYVLLIISFFTVVFNFFYKYEKNNHKLIKTYIQVILTIFSFVIIACIIALFYKNISKEALGLVLRERKNLFCIAYCILLILSDMPAWNSYFDAVKIITIVILTYTCLFMDCLIIRGNRFKVFVTFGIFLVYIYYIGASLFWTKCYTIPTLANVNSCDMQLALSSSILMLLSGGIYTSLRERKRALKFMFVYEAFYKETMTNSTRRKDRKKISRLSVIEQRAQMVERNSQV